MLIRRQQWRIQTGAYTGGRRQQFDDRGNYRADWAIQKGFAPQGMGGIEMELSVRRDGSRARPHIRARVLL